MGNALLSGWLGAASADRYLVVEPAGDVPRLPGVIPLTEAAQLPRDTQPAVVLFAVKPQVMDEIVPAYRRFAGPQTVFLSIAAGRTTTYFHDHLGDGAAVVRAMPNTPAAIGCGVSVLFAAPGVTADQRELCSRLLAAVGSVEWIEDEGLMDAVTAVSGGGPAYLFLLIEALAAAGAKAGLPQDLAERLARRTVIGAGMLADRSTERPQTLRQNVTSPGGTTQAALNVLMADAGIGALFEAAVSAAAERSRELAG